MIRPETPEDIAGIRRVHEMAFGGSEEADIVDRLRASGHASVSLVAEEGGVVTGHILFSPVTIEGAGRDVPALGLGPMAVLPEDQRRGTGSRLVRAGLEACRRLGSSCLVVLGHPEYYPRFGFVPASRYGLECEFPAPEEAFMALELRPGALRGVSGTVHYRPEFRGSGTHI